MMKYSFLSCMHGGSADEVIKAAKALHLQAVDWTGLHGETPETLRRKTLDAGLEISAHTFFLAEFPNGTWLGEAEKHLDDACAMGANLVMLPTPGNPEHPDRREYRKLWTDALAKIGPLAAKRGLVFTIENFDGIISPFITANEFLEAAAAVPELKLTFDCGNAFTGEDPLVSLEKTKKFLRHVHLKDLEGPFDCQVEDSKRMLDGRWYRFSLPMQGNVGIDAVIRKLEKLGYTGYANLEYQFNRFPLDRQLAALRKLPGYRG